MTQKPPVFHWEMFYKHQTKPYEDRHWLWLFIPELFPVPPTHSQTEVLVDKFVCAICGETYAMSSICEHVPAYESEIDLGSAALRGVHVPFATPRPPFLRVLDVGCGTGSTCFPLLEKNGQVCVTAFDYSARAIDWLKAREFYDPTRLHASVGDATTFAIDGEFDVILLVFVLSSIDNFMDVLKRCKEHLSLTGFICIIDYTKNDDKVTKRKGQEVEGGIECKRDGNATTLIGFDVPQLIQLITANKMRVYDECVHERLEHNRKTGFQFIRSQFVIKCGTRPDK